MNYVDDLTDSTRRRRFGGAGRKGIQILEYDDEIVELILDLWHIKTRVTLGRPSKTCAWNTSKRKASDGWLTEFMERNSISFR